MTCSDHVDYMQKEIPERLGGLGITKHLLPVQCKEIPERLGGLRRTKHLLPVQCKEIPDRLGGLIRTKHLLTCIDLTIDTR